MVPAALWNPIEDLSLGRVERERRCNGFTRTGAKCENPIAKLNWQRVMRDIHCAAFCDPQSAEVQAWLPDLACTVVCRRDHQYQASYQLTAFQRSIVKLRALQDALLLAEAPIRTIKREPLRQRNTNIPTTNRSSKPTSPNAVCEPQVPTRHLSVRPQPEVHTRPRTFAVHVDSPTSVASPQDAVVANTPPAKENIPTRPPPQTSPQILNPIPESSTTVVAVVAAPIEEPKVDATDDKNLSLFRGVMQAQILLTVETEDDENLALFQEVMQAQTLCYERALSPVELAATSLKTLEQFRQVMSMQQELVAEDAVEGDAVAENSLVLYVKDEPVETDIVSAPVAETTSVIPEPSTPLHELQLVVANKTEDVDAVEDSQSSTVYWPAVVTACCVGVALSRRS